jgi:Zn ribbon nucleic-acid-binding protein
MKCKKCKSTKVRPYKYEDVDCYECSNCGYDSCEEYEQDAEERSSQKEKGRYTPYKAGRK